MNTPAIFLCPQYDNTYSACYTLGSLPSSDAVHLVNEQEYPVNVYFMRSDLNGSADYHTEICENLNELLSTLDWCGQCRYMITAVWDHDLDKTENKELVDLLADAWSRRMELGREEAEEAFGGMEEDPVRVYAVSAGGVKREIYSGSLEECTQFCNDNNWTFFDENRFEWNLELDGDLEMGETRSDLDDLLKGAQERAGTQQQVQEPRREHQTR